MNQKNLYIAIIVVVAIIVVMGLWLSGAGQTGPLAGSIGCEDVTLTADCYTPVTHTTVWGTLKTSSGTVLPNQHLVIEEVDSVDYNGNPVSWKLWGETDTRSDGKFWAEGGGVTLRPRVIYNGGDYNGVIYCSASVVCHYVPGLPLKW
jgi:hypothetical protein